MFVAQAAEAAKGTVRAVPNTAAPTIPGRARIRATTSSVASREPIPLTAASPGPEPPKRQIPRTSSASCG